jgi:hypothetical protein
VKLAFTSSASQPLRVYAFPRHPICEQDSHKNVSRRRLFSTPNQENIMKPVDTTVVKNSGRGTDSNPDLITGQPGAHPVGTGVGAAVAGAAAGAAGGLVAGPVGAAVGAVIGGVAGGLAGKGVAESIDPTVEDRYWREHYSQRPYYDANTSYDDYQPAYKYGWESRAKHADRSFDQAESDLKREWDSVKDRSKLSWDKAKHATRDAWNRIGKPAV